MQCSNWGRFDRDKTATGRHNAGWQWLAPSLDEQVVGLDRSYLEENYNC